MDSGSSGHHALPPTAPVALAVPPQTGLLLGESRPSLPLGLDSPHVCQGQLPLIFSFPAGGLADSPLRDLGASPQHAQNRGLNAQRASSHCILSKTGRAWLLRATRRERWVESLAGFYSLLIPGDKNKFSVYPKFPIFEMCHMGVLFRFVFLFLVLTYKKYP